MATLIAARPHGPVSGEKTKGPRRQASKAAIDPSARVEETSSAEHRLGIGQGPEQVPEPGVQFPQAAQTATPGDLRKTLILDAVTSLHEEEMRLAVERISKMTDAQVLLECQVQTMRKHHQFVIDVAQKIRSGAGYALDRLLKAEGEILSRFEQDNTLHHALVSELSFAEQYLNNKAKIAICAGSDTVTGFQAATRKRKAKDIEQVSEQATKASHVPSDTPQLPIHQSPNDPALCT